MPLAVQRRGIKKKNLMVGIGLQQQHKPRYMETIDRIHNGIGSVITQRVYWNGDGVDYAIRDEGQTEMEFQTNNLVPLQLAFGSRIL